MKEYLTKLCEENPEGFELGLLFGDSSLHHGILRVSEYPAFDFALEIAGAWPKLENGMQVPAPNGSGQAVGVAGKFIHLFKAELVSRVVLLQPADDSALYRPKDTGKIITPHSH